MSQISPHQARRPLYAKLAIARKQLPDMDEDAYRDLLQNTFGVRSASALDWHQLSRLIQIFADMGVIFTSKGTSGKPPAQPRPHVRSDYYHIADDEFGPIKRKICAIWKGLGYDMTSLDTRCKREFGVESFAWLRDLEKLRRLLLDVENRESAKHAKEWNDSTQADLAEEEAREAAARRAHAKGSNA